MTKLEKLYKTIQNLKELGLELGEDLLNQTNELEEQIIKNEILPVLTEKIEPALSQVQRELVLIVDYVPNEPISVRLSRKRNFVVDMKDSKEIKLDPLVEHNLGNIKHRSSKKSPRTNLRVTFKDGTIIQNGYAFETLKQTIQRIGVDKVRKLGLVQCGVPLISNVFDNAYSSSQKDISNGLYLMTLSSTASKKQQLDKISNALNLDLKVEII